VGGGKSLEGRGKKEVWNGSFCWGIGGLNEFARGSEGQQGGEGVEGWYFSFEECSWRNLHGNMWTKW